MNFSVEAARYRRNTHTSESVYMFDSLYIRRIQIGKRIGRWYGALVFR